MNYLLRKTILRSSRKRYSDIIKGKDSLIERIQQVPPADIVSGVPEELKQRTVRIFIPAKSAMQSGLNQTKFWRLDFDILENGSSWENSLIGYASSYIFKLTFNILERTQCRLYRLSSILRKTLYCLPKNKVLLVILIA